MEVNGLFSCPPQLIHKLPRKSIFVSIFNQHFFGLKLIARPVRTIVCLWSWCRDTRVSYENREKVFQITIT